MPTAYAGSRPTTAASTSSGPNPFRDEFNAASAGLANPYRASTAAGIDLRGAAAVSATTITPRVTGGTAGKSGAPSAGGAAAAAAAPPPPLSTAELSAGAFSSLLGDVRRRRLGADATPLTIDRVASSRDLAAGGGAGGTGAVPLASPTGSVGATVTFTKDAAGGSGAGGGGSAATTSAPALGARKPNYDHIVAHDLFLLSWTREALTARMLECHGGAVKLLAEQETTLAEIFNFYAQLGQVRSSRRVRGSCRAEAGTGAALDAEEWVRNGSRMGAGLEQCNSASGGGRKSAAVSGILMLHARHRPLAPTCAFLTLTGGVAGQLPHHERATGRRRKAGAERGG